MLAGEALNGATGQNRRRARVLRAQALLRDPSGHKGGEDELKAALAEDPGNAEAHFLLGMVYKSGGAASLAAASLRRALALRPRHGDAQVELAALDSPGTEARGSVMKKLFG